MRHAFLRAASALAALALVLCATPAGAVSTTVVISQVYGGGGASSGSPTYKNDYVELFNLSDAPQTLTGYSVQYGSSTGNFGSSTSNIYAIPTVIIQPGQHLLIQLGSAGTVGGNFPVTPDLSTTNLNLSASSGKVALANVTTALGCGATPCTLPDPRIVDLVSYGTANNGEGGTTVNSGVALTNAQGGVRKTNGCTETDNNAADFDVVTNPVPRNTVSTLTPCGPSISINDVTALEGNSGTTTFTFTVTLSTVLATDVTFTVDTGDGTATAGSDYTPISVAPYTISAGTTSTTIDVAVAGDTTVEPDETFYVNLSNAVGAVIADGQGLGTIQNDDSPPVLSIGNASIAEGDAGTKTLTFTASLSFPAPSDVTFTVDTANGTATAGSDYVAVTAAPYTISAGSSSATIDVTINGDTANEPDETFTVNLTGITGATPASLSATGTIRNDDPTNAIHEVQGSGTTSSFAGSSVTLRGIVTALRTNGYYLQAADTDADSNPSTSEAIFVFTSSAPTVAVGNDVTVTGTVSEYVPTADPLSPPLTELASPTGTIVNSTGNPLPTPAVIHDTDTLVNSIENLEMLEGMRVSIPSLTVVSPTQGSVDEANATSTANGVFYGVVTGVARPFREPGIQANDPLPSDAPAGLVIGPGGVPRFDFNPERIRVNMKGQAGGASIDVTAGATVTNIVGVLHYDYRTYTVYPDPATPPTVTGNLAGAVPVTAPLSTEFTVATANLQHYYDTVKDAGVSDVQLTAAAYARRLAKVSMAVRNVMRFPDILAVEEAEKLSVLNDLSAKISADAIADSQPDPMYVAYLQSGNDISNINVGFLVKSSIVTGTTPRVAVTSVTQYNKTEQFVNPDSSTENLNDRPPLELVGTVNHPNGTSIPVTLLVIHDKALSGVDDGSAGANGWTTVGARNRAKRQKQAESVAALVQARQGQNLIVLGDFNAYEFNDGYVDVVGTIAGSSAPASQVVLASTNTVTPALTVLDLTDPATDRYSYTYDGSAQAIDHILVNQSMAAAAAAARVERAHVNADFPEDATTRGDGTRPEKYADHDPAVAYFAVATFPVELTSFSAE